MRMWSAVALGVTALLVSGACDSAPAPTPTPVAVSFVDKGYRAAVLDRRDQSRSSGRRTTRQCRARVPDAVRTNRGTDTPASISADFTLAAPAARRTEGGLICLAIGNQLITSGGEPKTLDLALHAYVTREKWTITVYDGSNHVARPAQAFLRDLHGRAASGTFAEPLVDDGRTEYTLAAQIDGDEITLRLPDGSTATAKDPRIDSYGGRFGFVQVMGDQTQDKVAVVSAEAQ